MPTRLQSSCCWRCSARCAPRRRNSSRALIPHLQSAPTSFWWASAGRAEASSSIRRCRSPTFTRTSSPGCRRRAHIQSGRAPAAGDDRHAYVWGEITGKVFEAAASTSRSGLGDLRIKVSVNLFGTPALTPAEFARPRGGPTSVRASPWRRPPGRTIPAN